MAKRGGGREDVWKDKPSTMKSVQLTGAEIDALVTQRYEMDETFLDTKICKPISQMLKDCDKQAPEDFGKSNRKYLKVQCLNKDIAWALIS